MRKSVYLDSTILNYLFDERESIRQFVDITKIWWNTQRTRYRLFLSGETLAEINEGDYPHIRLINGKLGLKVPEIITPKSNRQNPRYLLSMDNFSLYYLF
jgi:hypothetical protein